MSIVVGNNQPLPLIFEKDESFIKSIRNHPKAEHYPPHCSSRRDDALDKINNPKIEISAFFINPFPYSLDTIELIRHIHAKRVGTPVYFIKNSGDQIPFSPSDLKELAVQAVLEKPMDYEKILNAVGEFLNDLKLLQIPAEEIEIGDDEFTPIRASHFISGNKSFFTVYIRLSRNKYIKLLNEGDSFSAERVLRYLKKGVLFFYLKRQDQKRYLDYCQQIAGRLLETDSKNHGLIREQILNLGEETVKYLKDNGVQEHSLAYVDPFLQSLSRVLSKEEMLQHSQVRKMLVNASMVEHGLGVAIVSLLISSELGINSEKMKFQIGLAAFFHDIGLEDLMPGFGEENQIDKSKLSLFIKHPERSSKIISKLKRVSPFLLHAIEQHHERRTGKGFPNGLGVGQILPLAEVIGLSDEFVLLMTKHRKGILKSNPVSVLRSAIFDQFSAPILLAFERLWTK